MARALTVPGTLRLIEARVFADGSEINILRGDCQQNGHIYEGGAYKVHLADIPGMRTKTFLGEMAWAQASSYARDAACKKGDWRWSPNI